VATHKHYQNHRWDRGERFLKEKIGIIERVLAAGGRTHLILAGCPVMTARIAKCLPAHLRAMLMELPPPSSGEEAGDLLAATLSTYRTFEPPEPLDTVAELLTTIRNGGLGAAGTGAVLDALWHCQVDVLVMDRSYEPGQAWSCRHCGCAAATTSPPERCPGCDSSNLQSDDVKAIMVRLADEQSVEVEIVDDSDLLRRLGGVGCLLRYARPKQVRMAVLGRSA
jgi:peptide subunit release factor 1 (eRF1)